MRGEVLLSERQATQVVRNVVYTLRGRHPRDQYERLTYTVGARAVGEYTTVRVDLRHPDGGIAVVQVSFGIRSLQRDARNYRTQLLETIELLVEASKVQGEF